jgi:hypothetical protein
MLPIPLSTSKLIVPLRIVLHTCTQGANLFHMLPTGSHVEFCGGSAQKIF